MYDVIVFGSATWDIFVLHNKNKKQNFFTPENFCLLLGAKIDVKDFLFKTGGGGTNTAVGFGKQGLKVAYYGAIGETLIFEKGFIMKELKNFGIAPFIFEKKGKKTNISIVLGDPKKDRTILVYRGASELLSNKDINWQELKTKWFYLAPLSGKLVSIFETIVNLAKKNNIFIAANLGNSQINLSPKILSSILRKIDVLFLNQEEANLLIDNIYRNTTIKTPITTEKEIFHRLRQITPAIIAITKGKQGACVFDEKYIYQAKILRTPQAEIVDLTGAGDAFCSGFMSVFMKNKDIVAAIQLGMANSYSCIQFWGAKDGLLKKEDSYDKVEVKKTLL